MGREGYSQCTHWASPGVSSSSSDFLGRRCLLCLLSPVLGQPLLLLAPSAASSSLFFSSLSPPIPLRPSTFVVKQNTTMQDVGFGF